MKLATFFSSSTTRMRIHRRQEPSRGSQDSRRVGGLAKSGVAGGLGAHVARWQDAGRRRDYGPGRSARAGSEGRARMRRHHWILVGGLATLLAGWLLWNVLSVEQDLAGPGGGTTAAPDAQP